MTFAVKDDFPAYGTTRIQFNGLSTGALAVSAAQRTFVQTTDFPATLRSGNPDVLNFISSQPTVAAHEENLAAEIWFEPTIKTGAVIGIGQGTNSQFTLKLVSDSGQEVYLGIVSGTFTLRSYTVTASTYKIEGTLFGKRDANISGSVSISGWILM